MKKFLIAAGVLGLMAAPAVAADMPRKAAPAPMYAPLPVMTWAGFYAGVNAGYGWASGGLDGFVGGGQLGYNWQSGNLVFGIEGDFQGTAQDRQHRSRRRLHRDRKAAVVRHRSWPSRLRRWPVAAVRHRRCRLGELQG